MYDFACYLLRHYNRSFKTFLLGHWEGDGRKQPSYFLHEKFLTQAHRYVAEFKKKTGRMPTATEYRYQTLEWLKNDKKNEK